MWLQRFTRDIVAHRPRALLITFLSAVASAFMPIVGVISISIATLITLMRNTKDGALFTAAATVPYLISIFLHDQMNVPLVLWAGVGVAMASNILTYAFAIMLRRKTSWGQLLQIAALFGVLIVSVIHLIYPDVAEWWGTQLQSYYSKATTAFNLLTNSDADIKNQQYLLETINVTKQYATGFMVAGVLFNAVMQLIVARWWQAVVFVPGMLRKELHHIRLSPLAGVLFIVGVGLAYWGNSVALDMMPILYLLFAAAGLSLIHYSFGLMHSKMRWFWLTGMYIALIFTMPVSIFFIASIGLFDIWLDLRKKLKKS